MSSSYSDFEPALRAGEARSHVSWSAIFAGAVLVIAVQVLLSVLGAGVGLGLANPADVNGPGIASLGTGAGVWWLGCTIVSLLVGSFTAARLAGVSTRFDGVLHGLVIWGVALMLTVYLLTSAVGGIIGGAYSVVGGVISSATHGAQAMLPKRDAAATVPDANALQQQAERLFDGTTPQDPGAMSRSDAAKAVAQALPDLFAGGDKAVGAKQRITAIVAAQAHISPQDAQQRVDEVAANLNQAKDQAAQSARHAAEVGATVASRVSILAFAGLLAGAVAAAIGGGIAQPRRTFRA